MTPFDFVNSINFNKEDLFQDPQAEKDYVPFLVNKALSYFPDTVLYANEINRNMNMPKRWQFDFLRISIPKRKRFSKWAKKPVASDDVKAVSEYYHCSSERAVEYLDILTTDQIQLIKTFVDKGGK